MAEAAAARRRTAKTTAMVTNLKATVSSKDSLNLEAIATQALVLGTKAMVKRKDDNAAVEKMKGMVGRVVEDMEKKKDGSTTTIARKKDKAETSTIKEGAKNMEKSMKDAAIIGKRKADTEVKAHMDNKAEVNLTSKEARAMEKNTKVVDSIVRRRVDSAFKGDRNTILGAAMG
ncbi:hypothetical protein MMC17_003969 [Xylographa soralifera]|nr:hypothetical protein [Xylographa soralifera]